MKITVLTPEKEIFRGNVVSTKLPGALKDHKRAIVLGEKSFGKGSVQSIMPLSNGGGLRLTTAKYYLPSGETIEEIGVQPDIKVEQQKN